MWPYGTLSMATSFNHRVAPFHINLGPGRWSIHVYIYVLTPALTFALSVEDTVYSCIRAVPSPVGSY